MKKTVITVNGTERNAINGMYEYYINLNYEGDTLAQTALMQYIVNSDGVMESEYFPNLVKQVRWYKEEKEGIEYMCEILEQEFQEGKIEGDAVIIRLS